MEQITTKKTKLGTVDSVKSKEMEEYVLALILLSSSGEVKTARDSTTAS